MSTKEITDGSVEQAKTAGYSADGSTGNDRSSKGPFSATQSDQTMNTNAHTDKLADASQSDLTDEAKLEDAEKSEPLPPIHSIFSPSMKVFIVIMTTLSTLFSPMSSFIYLPAVDTIASEFHRSISDINLTITTYMILQGIAPMFFGDMADQIGRRPVYVMTFTVYCAANIGLALQSNYVALLILRAMQSAGSSATVAIGNAVVSDIVTRAERGGYIGYVLSGVQLGTAIAPTIGGLLTQFLGWRSVFWFLLIAAGIFVIIYIALVPETCRLIVGDGSFPPPTLNKSLVDIFKPDLLKDKQLTDEEGLRSAKKEVPQKQKLRFPNPLNSLRMIIEKDVSIVMFVASMRVVALYCMMVPLPTALKKNFQFNDLEVGLCYLPFCVGSLIGSIMHGKLLDWNYNRLAKRMGITIDRRRAQEIKEFPVEKARLDIVWIPSVFAAVAMIGYGWTLQTRTNLAAPLIVLFMAGFFISGPVGALNALMVDLYPSKAATVSAAFNVCRCLLGAGASAVVQLIIDAWGEGWAYTFFGLVSLAITPLLLVNLKWGPKWREERFQREESKRLAKEKKKAGLQEKV